MRWVVFVVILKCAAKGDAGAPTPPSGNVHGVPNVSSDVRALALCLVLVCGGAAASEPLTLVLHDWDAADFVAGAPIAVAPPGAIVNEVRVPLAVPACQRLVLLDAFYSPNQTRVAVDGVGEVAVVHELRASLAHDGVEIGSARVNHEGYGFTVALAPAAGDYELRLVETLGPGIHVDFRVRGQLVQDDPACVT